MTEDAPDFQHISMNAADKLLKNANVDDDDDDDYCNVFKRGNCQTVVAI